MGLRNTRSESVDEQFDRIVRGMQSNLSGPVPENITEEYLAGLSDDDKQKVINEVLERVDNSSRSMAILKADLSLIMRNCFL